MKIILKDIGKFNELLLRKGFTRRELGRQASISEVYAQQISNGDRNPGAKVAKRICETLEVDFDEIFFVSNVCKSEQTDIDKAIG
ncbi:MAG TPA: XRE family transcriptional regulator [Syntrophomonas wolfei]|uniref:XRE family transcriptional regulator n=1 Tax=Syntrophomonas wolfei TaxID=863 RepID=A0A354YWF8_9FIRM|nr:XRE family transcriptional regulator [Syntrophomonas wolfei]